MASVLVRGTCYVVTSLQRMGPPLDDKRVVYQQPVY
jgi:hypothetical protein